MALDMARLLILASQPQNLLLVRRAKDGSPTAPPLVLLSNLLQDGSEELSDIQSSFERGFRCVQSSTLSLCHSSATGSGLCPNYLGCREAARDVNCFVSRAMPHDFS